MEIAMLGESTIRVKGKQASIVLDPVKGIKQTTTDGIVILDSFLQHDFSKIENSRLTIKGPGEYEIGGIKVSSQKIEGELMYTVMTDGLEILFLKSSVVEKAKDKARDYDILVVKANTSFDASHLASFSPKVICLYGEKAGEASKSLGKEGSPTQKYQTTVDKLPEETEIVILG